MPKFIAFLPCRKGSERIRNKNTRPFAGVEGGLTAIKLEQLGQVESLEEIIVSTNDPEVMLLAEEARKSTRIPIMIEHRAEELCSRETTTDALIEHVPTLLDKYEHSDVVLWTHVTSPFYGPALY